jgi:hypothetical protein
MARPSEQRSTVSSLLECLARQPLALLLPGLVACGAAPEADADPTASSEASLTDQGLRGGTNSAATEQASADPAIDLAGAGDATLTAQAVTGNGGPSGAHFNLNLIGMSRAKSVDLTGNNGGRIFIPLSGSTKILLSEGDFQVLDANGTDGSAAFQLPNPDPDGDGTTSYSVFARALGKPGGAATLTTCATDPATGEELCSLNALQLLRTGGKQRFANVSRELLFIEADIDGDGVAEQVSLFDESLQDFFWQVDNQGLRLAQLRFYPVATTVQ